MALFVVIVSACQTVPANPPGAPPSSSAEGTPSEAAPVFIEASDLAAPEQPDPDMPSDAPPEPEPTVKASSADAQLAAKQAYAMAVERFEAHDYAGALRHFELAHAHYPHPAMQYNIAHCHEELGHRAEACTAYGKVEVDVNADAGMRQDAARSRQRLSC